LKEKKKKYSKLMTAIGMDNIKNIQQYIAAFRGLDNYAIAEKKFVNNEDILIWQIIKRCNFSCSYCGVPNEKSEFDIDIETIKSAFNKEGKRWLVLITGGEPFLKKNIVDIIEALTDKHYVHINTNLSTANIEEFAHRINPKNVYGLNIAAHILEREKHDKDFKQFVYNINLLQDKGFPLFISYVFHPELKNRVDEDFKLFKQAGVKEITLRPFMGNYKNVQYPAAYTDEEMEYLKKYGKQDYELGTDVSKVVFKNNSCLAGKRTFFIDEKGLVYRCEPYYKANRLAVYGNFFDGTFKPDKAEKTCTLDGTTCPFQCLFYAKKKNRSFINFICNLKNHL